MVGSILTAETGHDHRKGVVESEHLVREKTEGHYFAIEAVEMRALLAALEARDGYTGEHSETVMGLAVEVACRMRLPEEELRVVGDVALLHDIGKACTLDPILRNQGPLDEQECEVMQEHIEVGARMVASVKGLAHLAPWSGLRTSAGTARAIPSASKVRRYRWPAASSTSATLGTP